MPYDKKPGAAVRMYDKKGKPAGLMLEGSVAYMDHGDSAAKFTGMSGGSSLHLHKEGHEEKKKKPGKTKEEYISNYIQEEQKKKGSNLTIEELMEAKKSAEGMWKQLNVGSL
jgi:hypothetical protein